MEYLHDDEILNAVRARTVSNHSSEPFHFTLFHFEVNRAHKLHDIFGSDGIKEFLTEQYMVILKGQQLRPLKEYREYGGGGKKYLVKAFSLEDQNKITLFRTEFYKWITAEMKRNGYSLFSEFKTNASGKSYRVFSTSKTNHPQPEEFFAVPEYHYGIGNWESHISLMSGDAHTVSQAKDMIHDIENAESELTRWSNYTIGDNSSLRFSFGGRNTTKQLIIIQHKTEMTPSEVAQLQVFYGENESKREDLIGYHFNISSTSDGSGNFRVFATIFIP